MVELFETFNLQRKSDKGYQPYYVMSKDPEKAIYFGSLDEGYLKQLSDKADRKITRLLRQKVPKKLKDILKLKTKNKEYSRDLKRYLANELKDYLFSLYKE